MPLPASGFILDKVTLAPLGARVVTVSGGDEKVIEPEAAGPLPVAVHNGLATIAAGPGAGMALEPAALAVQVNVKLLDTRQLTAPLDGSTRTVAPTVTGLVTMVTSAVTSVATVHPEGLLAKLTLAGVTVMPAAVPGPLVLALGG